MPKILTHVLSLYKSHNTCGFMTWVQVVLVIINGLSPEFKCLKTNALDRKMDLNRGHI